MEQKNNQSNHQQLIIPWVNKYRPRLINDIILDNNNLSILEGFFNDPSNIPPSILFYGPPGVGKTTFANMLQFKAEEMNIKVLEVYGSVNNGIDYVRNNIIPFCNIKGRRFVRIEEFDRFTKDAQMALRNIMGEDRYVHVSFVLTCNELWRVHDAIQSRSSCFRFDSPDKNICINRLKNILDVENIKYDKELINDQLLKLIELFYPRIRDMISMLQLMSQNGIFEYKISELIERDETIKAVYLFDRLFSTGNYNLKEIVKISNNIKYQSFYDIVHDKYMNIGVVEVCIECKERINKLNINSFPELDFISFFRWVYNFVNN